MKKRRIREERMKWQEEGNRKWKKKRLTRRKYRGRMADEIG
jgi:hypothetical protein